MLPHAPRLTAGPGERLAREPGQGLTAAAISGVGRAIGVLAVNHGAWVSPSWGKGSGGVSPTPRIWVYMPPRLARLLSGLLIGLLISAVVGVLLVLPAVLLIRLFWGVWPTPGAWLWIGGALAGQALMVALRHAFTRRKGPNSRPGTHGSAPP